MAQISDPGKLLGYKLGEALGLERKVHSVLAKMEKKAQHPDLKQGLGRHRGETEEQMRNIEQAMNAAGVGTSGHQDPVMNAIAQHSEQMLERVDDRMSDSVLVGGTADTEHHEIAVYEGLIAIASSMGAEDVTGLLQENLDQERRMLEQVDRLANQLSRELASAER